MPEFNLRRFTQPDTLKAISCDNLIELLKPYESYFAERGLMLTRLGAITGLDYECLVRILMNPTVETPRGLLDALFFISEMATHDGMDALIEAAESNGLLFDGHHELTPADVAVQVYLKDRDLLERKHAEQHLTKPRSFEYFQTDRDSAPRLEVPSPNVLTALEQDLDGWYEKKKRGRGTRVFVFMRTGSVWFLVRHGDPLRREGSLQDGKASSVYYRPEKYDVLVYEPAVGELRMNTCGHREREFLRRQFGNHLFGDEDFFPGTGKYTLEPLRHDGEAAVACTDVAGLETVHLKEVQFFWGGDNAETEIRKADDVFAIYGTYGRSFPTGPRITRATFKVKFTDSKTPRTVTIRPSNVAQYARDSDSALVEDWLNRRGFMRARGNGNRT